MIDTCEIRFEKNEARLRIIKKDGKTGEIIRRKHAKFQIYDDKNQEVIHQDGETKVDTFETNEQGEVLIPVKLKYGQYSIHEVEAPEGYIIGEPVGVTIGRVSEEVDNHGTPIFTVDVRNDQPEGKLTIHKSFKGDDVNSYAKFKVTANSDIINPTSGEIVLNKGSWLRNPESEDGLYTITTTGSIEVSHLPLGTGNISYSVQEVEASYQYQLASEQIVTFMELDGKTKEYNQELTFTNELTSTSIAKEDSDTGELIEGAKLELYDDTDNTSIENWTTTTQPHQIDGLLRQHQYRLKEKQAPNGYETSEDIIFTATNQQNITMKDKKIKKVYKIDKVEKVDKSKKVKEPLIATGDIITSPYLYLIIMAFSALFIVLYIRKKIRKKS